MHQCGCKGVSSWGCPVCVRSAHLEFLRKAFPEKVRGLSFEPDFPLFPTEEGRVVTKDAMTETIVAAARILNVQLVSAEGTEQMSGHTLRVTGAQGLSRLGLDLWAIQVYDRWGRTPSKDTCDWSL